MSCFYVLRICLASMSCFYVLLICLASMSCLYVLLICLASMSCFYVLQEGVKEIAYALLKNPASRLETLRLDACYGGILKGEFMGLLRYPSSCILLICLAYMSCNEFIGLLRYPSSHTLIHTQSLLFLSLSLSLSLSLFVCVLRPLFLSLRCFKRPN
jgi:hypothetical protein